MLQLLLFLLVSHLIRDDLVEFYCGFFFSFTSVICQNSLLHLQVPISTKPISISRFL